MDKNFEQLVHQYERDKAIHDCENVIGRLFYYTATTLSNTAAARRTMFRWPRVMGSKLPG